MEKHCTNCIFAAKMDGHWRCANNGYTVNARMYCEEWKERIDTFVRVGLRNRPLNRQQMILD